MGGDAVNDLPYDLSIPGWMSESELRWLHDTASQMASVVEIGSFQGRSTFALLQGCKGPVYAVDPWTDVLKQGQDNFEVFKFNLLTRNPMAVARLHPLRMPSAEAVAGTPDVDMVFIDGDHVYEAVALDIALWLRKARKLICGHDFGDPAWPGVTKAVRERFGATAINPVGAIWSVPMGPLLGTR